MRRTLSSNRRLFARISLSAIVGFGAALALAAPGSACNANDPVVPKTEMLDKQQNKDDCVDVSKALYTHTFTIDQSTHTATATIRLDSNLCDDGEQAFTLVSYLAPAATYAVPQYVFEQETHTVSNSSPGFTFEVAIPECYTQVDFIFGDQVINPITSTSETYGNDKVGSSDGNGKRSTAAEGSQQSAWYNGGDTVCDTAPSVEATSDCDGSVVLSLRNGANATSTTYVVKGENGYTTEVVVPRDNPVSQLTISADNAADLTVTSGGETVKEYSWTRPDDCVSPTITTSSDCSASSVTIDNPATSTTVEAVLLTAGEESSQTITIEAGDSQTVSFDAGATVSVTVNGKTTILDLAKPTNCDSPSLPVTGTNAVIIAGVAILLVAGGTGMFFVTRRRRVTFRA